MTINIVNVFMAIPIVAFVGCISFFICYGIGYTIANQVTSKGVKKVLKTVGSFILTILLAVWFVCSICYWTDKLFIPLF